MGKILGIDLGTTNSAMSVIEGGEPVVIPNSEGDRTTPSVVAVSKNGERLVGKVAKRQAITNPQNTVFSVKRFIGRKFDDPSVQQDMKLVPYKLKKAPNGGIQVVLGDKEYSPQEVSAMILQKLKTDAEAYLGEKITQAVITVPAYFNDSQRQATKDAGKIAGLEVLRIINEPTASALAYGLDKKHAEEHIAVYDLGGGTFDISILDIGEGVFEVRSTNGDTHLGGDDFDQRIIDFLADEFKKQEGFDLRKDPVALQRLKDGAENAKKELSSSQSTEVNLPFITADANGPKHLNIALSRSKMEQLVMDLVDKSMEPVRQALRDAETDISKVDEVLLVGGMTRMPLVQSKVQTYFKKEPHKGINPDEVVAVGAGIQGGVLGGEVKDVLLLDVTPLTLSIETLGGVATALIERNTTIPTHKSQVFSTASDNQNSVEIHVVQGERPMASENKTLAKFILDGIPPSPRGMPQIEVTFDIDANGILNVVAKDKATSREQKVTITSSSGLNKDEIARMVREAEEHAAEDSQRRELIETKNAGESLAYSAEKTISEYGDKVPGDVKSAVEGKIATLREALKTENTEEIKKQTEELNKVLSRVGSSMYESAGAAPGAGGPGAGDQPGGDYRPNDDGTVEGEFHEV